jgi:hypothetical protein
MIQLMYVFNVALNKLVWVCAQIQKKQRDFLLVAPVGFAIADY